MSEVINDKGNDLRVKEFNVIGLYTNDMFFVNCIYNKNFI